MGVFDKIFGNDDEDARKRKADFSNVQSGSSSTAPAPKPFETEVRRYTVVAGDSLSKIAQREYGDASKWRAIHEANKETVKNPDLIYPGQVLVLPPNP